MEHEFSRNPTFDELVDLEPGLGDLKRIVEAAGLNNRRDDGGFCANAVWYGYSRRGGPYGEGSIRTQVIALVGNESHHPDPIMHTSGTYELVTQMLWESLPACDHEGPCGWGPTIPDAQEIAAEIDVLRERLERLEQGILRLVDAMESTDLGDPDLGPVRKVSPSFTSSRIVAAIQDIQRDLRRGG